MSLGDARRTHDDLYLVESEFKVKNSFKLISEHIPETTSSILDIGCSNGSLISYLMSVLPQHVQFTGVDIHQALLEKAAQNCPRADFVSGDVASDGFQDSVGNYDLVILAGVHTIFDDCDSYLDNCVSCVAPGGSLFIFGSMNPNPFDVITRVRPAGSKEWERGFNRPSLATMVSELERRNFCCDVVPFDIDFDLNESADAMRSYSIRVVDKDGAIKRILRNGLEQFATQYLLKARLV